MKSRSVTLISSFSLFIASYSCAKTPTSPPPPPPVRLAFVGQPSDAFVPATATVRVAVQDASGQTVTTANNSITVGLGTNPGGASLSGVTTRAAVNGIATFDSLSVDAAGTGYTLTASASALTSATSTAFNIVAFSSVSVGGESTCGLTTLGKAYCWGSNADGELGNGTSTLAANASPLPVSGGLTFTTLSVSDRFVCGVAVNAAAYCWGFNGQGNLGIGTSTGPQHCTAIDLRTQQSAACSTAPTVLVASFNFSAISAGGLGASVNPGDSFACGLSMANVAYCWGGNTSGQLGDSTFTDKFVPTAVKGGLSFATISTGRDYTCGVAALGVPYCWGSDCAGQLGDGRTGSSCPGSPLSVVPVKVTGGLAFRSVSASGWYWRSCGIAANGSAYCWGLGYLGDNTLSAGTSSPTAVSGGAFTSVSTGNYHTCGLTGGVAFCWGENTSGQLGDSTFTTAKVPVPVAGGLRFMNVSAGGNSTCGVTIIGAIYCWGDNADGQLGDGTTATSNVPVNVKGTP